MTRASVRRERVITVGAGEAWGVVGRPELLHLWFPGIEHCAVDGMTRTITTGAGVTLTEEIITNDPLQRRFQYRVSGGLFKEHLGTIDVMAIDLQRCIVSYASDADPATMAIILGGATEGALDELAGQLEASTGPAVEAARRAGPARSEEARA